MASPGRTASITGAPTLSVKTAAGRDVTVDEREPDADFYQHLLLGVQVAAAVIGRTTDAAVSVRSLSINRPFFGQAWPRRITFGTSCPLTVCEYIDLSENVSRTVRTHRPVSQMPATDTGKRSLETRVLQTHLEIGATLLASGVTGPRG